MTPGSGNGDETGFPATAGPAVIEVRDAVLESGARRLIDGISVRLSQRAVTVIMGPNGAGKSLLLRLMHGMIAPSAGLVLWRGAPLTDAARKRQAMVFQRPVLLRRSVAANIDFVLKLHGIADAAGTRDILDRVKLAELAGHPARLLSGGEQQRLSLARALAVEPDALFLDEPTASLDPASVLLIEEVVLAAHRAGTKIVFVTHDIGQARRLADEVVFLHRGRVCEQTPAGRFFDDPVSAPARDYLAGRIIV